MNHCISLPSIPPKFQENKKKILISTVVVLVAATALAGLGIAYKYQSNSISLSRDYSAGTLGAKWQFPSDHLPIAGQINDVNFAHWNILDTSYMDYILNNAQGLDGSLITTANHFAHPGDVLTIRESMTVDMVMQMIEHKNYPQSVMTLQEVSPQVFTELQKRLPKHMKCVAAKANGKGDIFIYNQKKFEFIDFSFKKYSERSNKISFLTLKDKRSGQFYEFIQSHVPGGDHSWLARHEFAEAIFARKTSPNTVRVISGDMNISTQAFEKALSKEALKASLPQNFSYIPTPYPTHINTFKQASWIDHIFVANTSSFQPISYTSLCDDSLKQTIELLYSLKPEITSSKILAR